MTGKNCLVLGDINIDFNIHAKAYPPEGGEAHSEQADFRLGGSGCLTAVALHRLGCPTTLAGSLGDDAFADFALQHIRAAGLDTTLIHRLPTQQTGFFMILVTPGGQRTMFGNRGANAVPLVYDEVEKFLQTCQHLHVSGYTLLGDEQYMLIRRTIEHAKSIDLSVSLDPGVCTSQQARDKLLDLLHFIDYLLPSMDELKLLAGEMTVKKQIASVLKLGCKAVALKMGAQGSRYMDGIQDVFEPAKDDESKDVFDTTGAGDCFNAGFLYSILNGSSPQEALQSGNAAAYRIITSPHGILDLIKE